MVDESNFVVPEYQGGYSSLEPSSGEGFVGYRSDINTLGLSTDPRSANILQEINTKLAPGQKHIELSLISPELIDTVPKQHLKEANRLAKLTGTEVTIHGPLVEPSGLTKEGFTETNRELVERQMLRAMEAAHEVNPNGGAPVTFHSAGMLPASEVRKISKKEREERGITNKEETHKMLILDQETGQMHAAKREEKYYPGQLNEKGKVVSKILTPEKQVKVTNDSQWSDKLSQLLAAKHMTDNILDNTYANAKEIYKRIDMGDIDYLNNLTAPEKEVFSRAQNASAQLDDLQTHLSSLYDRAYKYGSDEDKEQLSDMSKDFLRNLHAPHPTENKLILTRDPVVQSKAVQSLMEGLRSMKNSPKVHVKLEDFAMKKSTQTFANTAFQAYEKYGDSSPIISIENPPAGMFGLSRGKDLKNMVELSREKFAKKMVNEKSMDEGKAKEIAEKMIGVTWDVGHINQLRKGGFTEKDVVKETEIIAPYLKHVHLSDNFGVENVELPMGMGNVPLKEMMEKLGKKGKEARKIVEAGNWWTQFRINPMATTFENMGSPMYTSGMDSSPYWNQSVGLQQGYFGGYGQMLPQINYETFGAGFSNLPMELGGQRQGAQGSRMSGTGME
jgi:sugar phosphate isomerase/epimerase